MFHELATNAVKHGALASGKGRILVEWTIEQNDLRLTWREVDGPPVDRPSTTGFGSELITGTIGMLGGRIEMQWPVGGLTAQFVMPVKSIAG